MKEKVKAADIVNVIERLGKVSDEIADVDLYHMTGLREEIPTVELDTGFSLDMFQYGCGSRADFMITESEEPVEGYNTIKPNCPLTKAVLGKDKGYTTSYVVAGVETRVRIVEIYEKEKVKKLK